MAIGAKYSKKGDKSMLIRWVLVIIIMLIAFTLAYYVLTKEQLVPGWAKHLFGISDTNREETLSYISFNDVNYTLEKPTQIYLDCTFTNNENKKILIKEMSLVCALTKDSLRGKVIFWEEKTALTLSPNDIINKTIYFGKSREDLMMVFTSNGLRGLQFYPTLRIKYITHDGEIHHKNIEFGSLTIKGKFNGWTWGGLPLNDSIVLK